MKQSPNSHRERSGEFYAGQFESVKRVGVPKNERDKNIPEVLRSLSPPESFSRLGMIGTTATSPWVGMRYVWDLNMQQYDLPIPLYVIGQSEHENNESGERTEQVRTDERVQRAAEPGLSP